MNASTGRRWMLGSAFGALAAMLALTLALAAAGAFQHSPGDWRVTIGQLGARQLTVNVEAVLRFATSPVGLRLLDGVERRTAIGTVRARREGDTLLLRCAPCHIRHPRLAVETVRIEAVELRVRRRPEGLYDGVLAAGSVRIGWEARVDGRGMALRWSLEATPLAAIVAVLGDALTEGRIAHIEGRVRARGSVALPDGRGTAQVQLLDATVAGLGTERLQYGRFDFRCTTAAGSTHWLSTGDRERGWIALDRLGTHLPAAVIAAEDQRFAEHAGIDEVEIARVLAQFSLREGDAAMRGASTLTQQLARTVFTGGERTAVRKLRETLYALEMERTLGKPRILELYLNTVDWGPGICGARDAARMYFAKMPARLDPLEAAWLAASLRHPQRSWREEFVGGLVNVAAAQRVLAQRRDLTRRERAQWLRRALVLAQPPVEGREHASHALAQR